MEEHGQETFRRSEKFEINDIPFVDIEIDQNRITARGKSWTRFELLISFIGASWMERWRRFGTKALVAGVFLAGLPFFISFIPGFGLLFYGPSGLYLMLPFMLAGVALIILWAFVKKEALLVYTPGGNFKVEGTGGFVEAVSKAVADAQRARQV